MGYFYPEMFYEFIVALKVFKNIGIIMDLACPNDISDGKMEKFILHQKIKKNSINFTSFS
jgi:hypothetical protein